MPNRFEIERAVMASDLAAPGRHLMHVLCSRIDARINLILSRWQPSLTELARDTGYDRRTVTRHLTRLEHDGWITRVRPSLHDARTKHKRTQYTPMIPASYAQPGGSLGARGTAPLELGAQRPEARGTLPRKSSMSSMSGEETPSPANISDICGWCGRPGHSKADCPERRTLQ